MGLSILFAGNVFTKRSEYLSAKSDYDNVITIPASSTSDTTLINLALASGKESAYKSAAVDLTTSLYMLVGFWLFNVADAYFFSDSAGKISLRIGYIPRLAVNTGGQAINKIQTFRSGNSYVADRPAMHWKYIW